MKTIQRVMMLLVIGGSTLQACPTCLPAPGSNEARAVNVLLLSMLTIVGLMASAFGSFFFYLRKREKQGLRPEQELIVSAQIQ